MRRAAGTVGEQQQCALRVLVGECVQRLERACEFGQLEVWHLEREPARPPHRRAFEALVVFGLETRRTPSASCRATQPSSAAATWMIARLPAAMARLLSGAVGCRRRVPRGRQR